MCPATVGRAAQPRASTRQPRAPLNTSARGRTHGTPRADGPLRKEDLHGSLSDPVLDTMNFLNEITHRYPEAVSFAPGRPYDGFFETEQIFDAHPPLPGPPGRRRGLARPDPPALYQYGPTGARSVS